MRKVVFLDVDGVLNSREWFKRDRDGLVGQFQRHVNPECCRRVNRLCTETGAKVVISSTWRKLYSFVELRRGLRSRGLEANVIGKTPVAVNRGNPFDQHWWRRGYEIQEWLDTHPPVERFVILDDDDADMVHLRQYLVQTAAEVGLTDANVEQAIKMLTGP